MIKQLECPSIFRIFHTMHRSAGKFCHVVSFGRVVHMVQLHTSWEMKTKASFKCTSRSRGALLILKQSEKNSFFPHFFPRFTVMWSIHHHFSSQNDHIRIDVCMFVRTDDRIPKAKDEKKNNNQNKNNMFSNGDSLLPKIIHVIKL